MDNRFSVTSGAVSNPQSPALPGGHPALASTRPPRDGRLGRQIKGKRQAAACRGTGCWAGTWWAPNQAPPSRGCARTGPGRGLFPLGGLELFAF